MIIMYFSHTGTTKAAAETIHKLTGAALVRIEPLRAYPADYDALTDIAQREIAQDARPDIKALDVDLAREDTIFLGFPTWYYQPPMIIASLFENYDLAGKKIVPFTTSGSSPIDASVPFLKKLAGNDLQPGLRANARDDIE